MRVAVAGTFGPVHDGHRSLFETALECGTDGVVVGLASDAFARGRRDRHVPSFEQRQRAVEAELADIDRWGRTVTVRAIDDDRDFAATDPRLDALVVSEETADGRHAVNETRRGRGLDPLVTVVVPLVRAADGERISSTRVVTGEVDEHGNPTTD